MIEQYSEELTGCVFMELPLLACAAAVALRYAAHAISCGGSQAFGMAECDASHV
jgi:hypothetical protein